MNTRLAGKRGEALAAEHLRRKGYEIIGHGYRSRFGEIDLIARKKDVVAFVEVKLRKDQGFMNAYEAVTPAKQERIKRTALQWIGENPGDWQFRFDIIEVYAQAGTINVYENAFQ